jgi:hypothetical protein
MPPSQAGVAAAPATTSRQVGLMLLSWARGDREGGRLAPRPSRDSQSPGRAELVELTAAGRAAAARADAILDQPPAADVPAEDLPALLRVLERLAR